MRPLSSLDWTFGHDRVDLPEVVLSLSLVFEFERRAFRDGHDQAGLGEPKVGYFEGLGFLVLVISQGVGVVALLVEDGS